MNRRYALALILGVLGLALVMAVLWLRGAREETAGRAETGEAAPEVPVKLEGGITLFFPDGSGMLTAETRPAAADISAEGLVRVIAIELLTGPQSEGLYPLMPEGVEVLGALLTTEGIVYLDLGTPEFTKPPASGSERELLTAYSFVNSICENVPSVRGVVLLWNGEQRETFAGNLDTRHPLAPSDKLVRSTS